MFQPAMPVAMMRPSYGGEEEGEGGEVRGNLCKEHKMPIAMMRPKRCLSRSSGRNIPPYRHACMRRNIPAVT